MMKGNSYVIAGTYTKNKSKGIYVYSFDAVSCKLHLISVANVRNPSFLVSNTKNGCIYSVSENENGNSYANVLTFNSDTGKAELVNRRMIKSEGACHIAIDEQEKFVVTSNYGGGSISVLPIKEDGMLDAVSQHIAFSGSGEHAERQDSSHPHCGAFSPEGKYLFVTDLGTDTIYRFKLSYSSGKKFLDESSRKDFSVSKGSGPRHLIFDDQGKYAYLITELTGQINSYRYNRGELILIQEIPVLNKPEEGGGAIVLSPDGKYLFASMREGNDGISVFKTSSSGKLSKQGYYKISEHPRHIAVSADGKFLFVAAMKDNKIEIMKISDEGLLQNTENYVDIDMPTFIGFMN